jgi:O-antigen/teichoic acid export membrane protein
VTRHRDTTALASGAALNGLLAYVVFALTTRGLGAVEAAPVSVLWSYWALAGAALTFPVQHWITRTITAHGDGGVRRALPRLASVVVGLSLVTGVLATIAREPLFDRDDLWFPFLVALVTAGSALTGVTRGVLAGRRRFVAVAANLVVENALRCAAAAALLLAGVDSAVAYGFALVAGHATVLLWASSFRLAASTSGAPATSTARFLAAAGVGQLLHQVVLTGGPIALALMGGGQREVTALFAALSLYRAPFTLALGVVPQLTARVATLLVHRRHGAVRRLTRSVALVAVAAAVVAGVGGALVGPPLVELVFGGGIRIGAAASGWLAAGSVLAVGNLVLVVVALAQERPTQVARVWVGAGAVALLVLLAGVRLEPLPRTVAAFVVAELLAFVVLAAVASRGAVPAAGEPDDQRARPS